MLHFERVAYSIPSETSLLIPSDCQPARRTAYDTFLTDDARAVILEARDYGRAIPKELLSRLGQAVRDSGVGLVGMGERLNELKGDLEIASADPGTRLRAIMPLPAVARSDQHRELRTNYAHIA